MASARVALIQFRAAAPIRFNVPLRHFLKRQDIRKTPAPRRIGNATLSRACSTAALRHDDWEDDHDIPLMSRHCKTCTCEESQRSELERISVRDTEKTAACGLPVDDKVESMPPPLPDPSYSVRRRLLPSSLTALHSEKGTRMLMEALQAGTAASYVPLTEHWSNQTDPAYCGVTTLLTVLNAFAVDPGVRWRGGWRYYGDESVLLATCGCLSQTRVQRQGITLDDFSRMAACQGLVVETRRPDAANSFRDFEADVKATLQDPASILVTSFSRAALDQTGDGHFSPVAAYHAQANACLVLDVARFKYPPYWVNLDQMYEAMIAPDTETGQPRGWSILKQPPVSASYTGRDITDEGRRPAGAVPTLDGPHPCPVHEIKVEYCAGNDNNRPSR